MPLEDFGEMPGGRRRPGKVHSTRAAGGSKSNSAKTEVR
jgi:hypothetical protein